MTRKIEQIQHKRGLEKNLPQLSPGEIALTTDTKKVFIGSDSGNVEVTNKEAVNNLTTQVADTSHRIIKVDDKANREIVSRRRRKPMITIIDDDGRTDVLTKWEPILKEKNFKMSIAVITGWVGTNTYMTWEQLEKLKAQYNVDLVNHTHTHPSLGDLATEEEVRSQFKNSTDILKARGHSYDVMVYPYGSNSPMVRSVAREFCRTGVYTDGGVVTPPLETFRLQRATLLPGTGSMGTVESYTKFIDEAIAKNGWIIFMTHSQYESFDATKIKAVIDYANSRNVEWVHVNEGLDRIGNLIDFGDISTKDQLSEYTVLDADGIIHSKSNSKDFHSLRPDEKLFNTPITEFTKNTVSVNAIQTAQATGMPENRAGTLLTYRGPTDTFSWQQYSIYNSNLIYKRIWDNGGSKWADFQPITGSSWESGRNAYAPTTPATDFIPNKITYTEISSAHPNITDFPEGAAGVLITNRVIEASAKYAFQEYHTYNGNMYRRGSDWTAWRAWTRVGNASGTTGNRPTGVQIGYNYFDTSLGKPIWLKTAGATPVWVDATGATV